MYKQVTQRGLRKGAVVTVLVLLPLLIFSACAPTTQYGSSYVFSVGEEIVFYSLRGEESGRLTIDGWEKINDEPIEVADTMEDGAAKTVAYEYLMRVQYTLSGYSPTDVKFSAKDINKKQICVNPTVINQQYDFDDEELLIACNDLEGVMLSVWLANSAIANIDLSKQDGEISVSSSSSKRELYDTVVNLNQQRIFLREDNQSLKASIESLKEKNQTLAIVICALAVMLMLCVVWIVVLLLKKKASIRHRSEPAA